MCVSRRLMVFLRVASSLHCRKVWRTLWINERTYLSAYSTRVCLSVLDVTVRGSCILAAPTWVFSRSSVSSVRLTSGSWRLISSADLCCWGWRHFQRRCLPRTNLKRVRSREVTRGHKRTRRQREETNHPAGIRGVLFFTSKTCLKGPRMFWSSGFWISCCLAVIFVLVVVVFAWRKQSEWMCFQPASHQTSCCRSAGSPWNDGFQSLDFPVSSSPSLPYYVWLQHVFKCNRSTSSRRRCCTETLFITGVLLTDCTLVPGSLSASHHGS